MAVFRPLLLVAGPAVALAVAGPLSAQDRVVGGAAVDPTGPLDPMPAITVAWPVLPPRAGGTGARADTGEATRYTTRITGVEPATAREVLALFDDSSALKAGKGRADTAGQIDRRVRDDRELLVTVLRSQGYYDAAVEPRLATGADGRLAIELAARPGTRYRFDEVALPGLDGARPMEEQAVAAFAVRPGDPAAAAPVAAGRTALAASLANGGYPFAQVGDERAVVNHATQTASLTVPVTTGERARIGAIRLNDGRLFDADHVQDIAQFRPGDLYSAAQLDDLRRALVATGIVGSVRAQPVRTAMPGIVDVGVDLTAAKLRTVAGSLGYGTGEGARAEVSWQHRNLIRPEGAVTARALLGTQEQGASVDLRMNNFGARDRVLSAQIAASTVGRPAYQANFVTLTAALERKSTFLLQKEWTWSVGTELLASDERAALADTGLIRQRTYLIGALPLALGYDGSDSLLDPTRGVRVALRLSPELSLLQGTSGYLRAQLDGSGYLPVSDRLVLAGRGRIGTIVGLARDQLAPSRRFYAGGGASVRGYGYQDIGPRDLNNDPIGGRSLSELSVEARVRFGDFGVVPFVDAGNISSGGLPTLGELRLGAGLGVRYYSAFGPIRVDVGTPLNPQPGDPAVAVYVSLGQAY